MKRIHWLGLALIGLMLMAVSLSSCARGQKGGPAVEAPKPKAESDLAYLTITENAYKSLQIKSAKAHKEQVQAQVELTGWITVPQGHEVTLTAPQSGYLQKSSSGKANLVAGKKVEAGQELFQLNPVLTPVEELQMAALKRDVAGELAKAQISLKVADSDLKRIQELHKQKLRSDQEMDKAREKFDHAQESLNAAKDKQKLFVAHEPLPIKAPLAGTLLIINANPGEFVAKSAPLITIADLTKLWVRVPVPEYDVGAVKLDLPVTVTMKGTKSLGAKNAHTPKQAFTAQPVALVPQVDVQRHTVDLIYELPSQPLPFVKDQMVSVLLPLGKKQQETVIPYSAVVFDNQGGAWIYLDRGEKKVGSHEINLFQRRPVQLGPSVNGGVVIRPGLDAKSLVVIEGAAKLFSTEFHSAPGTQPEIDDDD